MTKIITIANIKGGVGKTVSTAAFGDVLSRVMDKKVLLIDAALGNDLSRIFWGDASYHGKIKTLGHMCWEECSSANRYVNSNYDMSPYIHKAIMNFPGHKEKYNNLNIIFSSDSPETFLKKTGHGAAVIIKAILTRLRELDKFDYILIDTCYTHSSSYICESFINNSDFLVIPSLPSPFSVHGADNLVDALKHPDGIKKEFTNSHLHLLGIFFCKTSIKDLTNAKSLIKESKYFDDNSVFNTFIPPCRDVMNSENEFVPVTRHSNSKASPAYVTLVSELLSKIESIEEHDGE